MSRYFPVPDEGEAQQAYGEKRPRIHTRRIDLDNERNEELLKLGGNFIWAARASSYTALAEIGFQQQGQGRIPFQQGSAVRVGPFDRIYLTNTAQSGEWIEIVVVREETGNFAIENPGSAFDTVQFSTPTSINTSSDVNISASSSALVVGANSNRKEAVIRSLSSNTNTARIGGGGVGATSGIPLEPGQSFTLSVTDNINAYNEDDTGDGSDVTIAIMQIVE